MIEMLETGEQGCQSPNRETIMWVLDSRWKHTEDK
jgi:hypothetical protein